MLSQRKYVLDILKEIGLWIVEVLGCGGGCELFCEFVGSV